MKLGTGNPTTPGVYACRQWYGWRVLEWTGKEWAYQGRHALWPAGVEPFEAWCGPLPFEERDHAPPRPLPIRNPAPMEFDL